MEDETRSLQPSPPSENKSSPGPPSAKAAGSEQSQGAGDREHPEHPRRNRAAMKQKAKRIAMWIGVAFVVLLLIAIVPRLFRSHGLKKDKQNQQNALSSVTVVQAQAVPPTIDLELSGTMSALTEAPLLARADGYLVKRYVDIGDHVHKGQLLALIDSPDLDQEVAQARAALHESESSLETAKSDLHQSQANQGLAAVSAQRWARLEEKGAVSRQENDTYQANFKAQTANVQASNANVTTATHNIASSQANLQRMIELQAFEQVRAPFDGVITERNLDVGSLISQGSTLLFRVAQIDVLRTYIEVPQTNAPEVKVGGPAWISFAEYPGRSFAGAITRTANSLDPDTRTMLTEVQLPNNDHRLFPGMYATVKLIVPTTLGSAVVIPGEAMMVRAEGPLVAVVTDQNVIHLQQINVGHDYGNTVEVLGGLKPGDKVVVNPGDNVLEGVKVNPIMSKQKPENPGSTGSGSPGQAAPKSQQSQSQAQGQGQGQSQGQSGNQSQGQSQAQSQGQSQTQSQQQSSTKQ